jgi:hypothetical protein
MSAATKFYNSHKEQILAYKKNWYAEKTKKISFFKNIKIKGITKKRSKEIFKTAIDLNILTILVGEGEDYKKYPFLEFINLYKFKDFSLIELDCYTHQYIKEEGHLHYDDIHQMHKTDFSWFITLSNVSIDIQVFENQLIKL